MALSTSSQEPEPSTDPGRRDAPIAGNALHADSNRAPLIGEDPDRCIWDRTCSGGLRPRERARLCSVHEIELLPWIGHAAESREICVAIVRARSSLPPTGSLVYAATHALAVLDLAAGQYSAALGLLHDLYAGGLLPYLDPSTLADMVEAGARGGDRLFAARALRHLELHVERQPTHWRRGVLARSRALHTTDDDAEQLYLEAISHLGNSDVIGDLARAHLLFGEWLRRQKRRAAARSHLRRSCELFEDLGVGCFAERAHLELMATGERARKRSVDTRNHLTPQELNIATLAGAHATNREIAQQLFISARTVEYHLHHVYQKLQISSRRELPAALAQLTDVMDVSSLELGRVG